MASLRREDDSLPVPNGWFAVGWSHELREGDVRPVDAFGHELVLFRTRSGKAAVLDAFCPHLGAHLGHGGRVMGETLRCPFHGWQYEAATGACSRIPYCERVPERARLRAWPVQEKNGMVFVWHHLENEAPSWDFPALPEIGSADWTEPRTLEWEIGCPVQDAHENDNDPQHFLYVHRNDQVPPTQIQVSPDGRHYKAVSQMTGSLGQGRQWTLDLVRESWGLGLNTIRMHGFGDAQLLLFASTTPLDEQRCRSRWLLTCSRKLVDTLGEEFLKGIIDGVQHDMPIWNNKVHRARPVLCETDETLAEFRRWARQFYSAAEPPSAKPS